MDEAAALQAALKRQHWDITFSDFSVPGFDAMAALALVREHDPDIPLIIEANVLIGLLQQADTPRLTNQRWRKIKPRRLPVGAKSNPPPKERLFLRGRVSAYGR